MASRLSLSVVEPVALPAKIARLITGFSAASTAVCFLVSTDRDQLIEGFLLFLK